MKSILKTLACGTMATIAIIRLTPSVESQTISGWGADSGDVSGVTITDSGNGNLTASGLPTGNADWRANLPTPVTGLPVGQTLTVSGTAKWTTTGAMGGGVFRIGLIDYSSLGTLSGGVWSVGPTATGYWFGPSTGGNAESNPGGGDVVGKNASGTWFSGSGGYGISTGSAIATDADPGMYNFSLSVQNNGGGVVSIGYTFTETSGTTPFYVNSGTVVDTKATVPLNFNAIGFFANASDTAFTSPGVSFANVTETIAASSTSTVLGSFQGSSDPTDAGWSDWTSDIAITAAAPGTDDQYSFPAAGVPDFAQSLEITPSNPGNSLNLSLNLSSSQMTAFLANSYLTFTFSAPAANSASSGYSQIANVYVNTPGGGFTALPWSLATETGNTANDSGGEPVFHFSSGSPSGLQTQIVTINYSSMLSSIGASPGYIQLVFNSESGSGAPANFYINNVELSLGPYGTAGAAHPPPPPTMGIQQVVPELRIFAGSTASIYDREQVDTSPDGDESWIGRSYPVSYSFTLLDFPVAPGMQCQLFLVPTATLPSGDNPTGNEYVDNQTSNGLSLLIAGGAANPAGSAKYTASLLWKVNAPNSTPATEALTSGTAYASTGNQSPVGTWTLTFTSANSGTLTPPGVSPLPFTISDANVATDFGGPAGPMLACFGLQPNATANEGAYIDYASISITGTAGAVSENFTTDPPGDTITSSGDWDITDSAAQSSLQLVNPASAPLWVYWSLPDTGYGLGVIPHLPATASPGNPGGFVLPLQYDGYVYDGGDAETIPSVSRAGGTNWTLIPYYALPSYANPAWTNAYFELMNPPPAN